MLWHQAASSLRLGAMPLSLATTSSCHANSCDTKGGQVHWTQTPVRLGDATPARPVARPTMCKSATPEPHAQQGGDPPSWLAHDRKSISTDDAVSDVCPSQSAPRRAPNIHTTKAQGRLQRRLHHRERAPLPSSTIGKFAEPDSKALLPRGSKHHPTSPAEAVSHGAAGAWWRIAAQATCS